MGGGPTQSHTRVVTVVAGYIQRSRVATPASIWLVGGRCLH